MRLGLSLLLPLAVLAGLWAFARSGDSASSKASGIEAEQAVAAPSPVPDIRLAGLGKGPLIGLADNRPETMIDPRFERSEIKRIRVLVPYDDLARGGLRRRYVDSWFDTARGRGIEPLVSFYRSYRDRHRLPSVASYRRNFRLFRRRYPWVRYFSTWDEANFRAAQPTGNAPRRTAEFYRAARDECTMGRCTVITAGFRAEGSAHSARWLREFKRHIGPGPHIWGLVAHPDVNRFQTTYTEDFLRRTSGPVWVTEVGAVNFFGRGLRPSISRQTRAMRFITSRFPRVSPRLRRMYVYHWRAAEGDTLWDSGLLSAEGQPRPAYKVFFQALGKPPADGL
jgi:hypothetical protein